MIETVYRVRCSGPCQRYLTPDGPKAGNYPDRGEYETREAAESAAVDAGWISCGEHALLSVCSDCRAC